MATLTCKLLTASAAAALAAAQVALAEPVTIDQVQLGNTLSNLTVEVTGEADAATAVSTSVGNTAAALFDTGSLEFSATQANSGDSAATSQLRGGTVWGTATSATTAYGNAATGGSWNGDVAYDTTQTMTGNTSAASDIYLDSAGDLGVATTAAANVSVSASDYGATSGTQTQVSAGNVSDFDGILRAWKSVIDIVLNGTFFCSQIIGQEMLKAGRGNILNIVATYAWTGGPGTVHSASAKAGVLAMTRTLAVEWAHRGIRVNAIAPGPFDTQGASSRLWPTEAVETAVREQIPLKRFATTEEVAKAALYLVSQYGSYITGECLTIDGGSWLGKGIGNMADFLDNFEEIRAASKEKRLTK